MGLDDPQFPTETERNRLQKRDGYSGNPNGLRLYSCICQVTSTLHVVSGARRSNWR